MTGDLFGRDPKPARQLTLDLPHRAALGREDFLVTPSNKAAVDMIDKWPDWPSTAILVTGPRGAGKTHLCEVWRARSGARRVTADDFSADMLPGLLDRGAVAFEDAPGGRLDETGLFHLLNLVREQNGSLLITARAPASQWGVKLPDLKSRLTALDMASLNEPDDALLRAVLVKLFADRQLLIEDNVLDYLIVRMERALGPAHDLVAELDRRALAEKRPITIPFAAQALSDWRGPDE
jgi:chromosomal replication initiation ATPase DnaA